jgi:hypothetical protein
MNLELWNKVSEPPKSALKQIGAGRLKGMTDVNPQWRIKAITEHFGPIGFGWTYEIAEKWTAQCENGELMVFVQVNLFTVVDGVKSLPIPGLGGSKLVSKESAGLHNSDEGYKMALTDALSVAMKQLGIGSAIYEGRWDGSKYKESSELPANAHELIELSETVIDLTNNWKSISTKDRAEDLKQLAIDTLKLFVTNAESIEELNLMWTQMFYEWKADADIKQYFLNKKTELKESGMIDPIE